MNGKVKKMIKKFSKLITLLPFNNSFSGKVSLINKGGLLIKSKIKSTNRSNELIIGKNCVLKRCKFTMIGDNCKIVLDDNIFAFNAEFYIEDSKGTISVGEGTYFAGKIHIACTEGSNIRIGKDCLFSSDVIIRNGDSHSIFDQSSCERINRAADVIICNHVWIGNRSMINKGSYISSNSVVGNGSIVTKAFTQENVVIAGVPAKIIREKVNWNSSRN